MICRVCSQWNPEGAGRCVFCDNDPAETADQSASGEPPQVGQPGATLRSRPARALGAPVSPPEPEAPLSPMNYVGLGLLGIGALMVLLGLVVRC